MFSWYFLMSDIILLSFLSVVIDVLQQCSSMWCCRWKCLGESLVTIYKHISTALVSQSACPYSIV